MPRKGQMTLVASSRIAGRSLDCLIEYERQRADLVYHRASKAGLESNIGEHGIM